MNIRDDLSVHGYIRQNFKQKCLIQEIIRTIIEFFKNNGGFLYVCGNGTFGQLGISEYEACEVPTLVQSVNEIVDNAASNYHTMLVDYRGRVWGFGFGANGKLGNETTRNSKTPQKIHLRHRAISVSVGREHSLILADNGSVLSCGGNTHGQLGQKESEIRVPKVIADLIEHKITQISTGYFHNGALSEKGDFFMWGWNEVGQCGVGRYERDYIKTPTIIKINEKVSMIDCGNYHSLLITMNNLLYSFGDGYSYKLGHGTYQTKHVPTLVDALKDVKIINVAGGGEHTLCVDDEFNVWAFGNNRRAQCGQPDQIREQRTPKQIEYFATNKIKAKYVAAGQSSSCVITQNNECFVFGNNDKYQIGLKETKGYFIPTKLPLSVQKVSMGCNHTTFISNYKEGK